MQLFVSKKDAQRPLETTRLLRTSTSYKHMPTRDETGVWMKTTTAIALVSLVVAASVAVSAFSRSPLSLDLTAQLLGSSSNHNPQPHKHLNQHQYLEHTAFTHTKGTDSNYDSTTVQELAISLDMPHRYQEMMDSLEIITENVKTCQVDLMRKIVLKFRDLLDILSPIYPNDNKANNNEIDFWLELCNTMSEGYKLVGTFLDFCHAHINGTDEQVDLARSAVLDWKERMQALASSYDFPTYLSRPTTTRYARKNSHLFWDNNANLPSGSDNAVDTLHGLGQSQTRRALEYFEQVSSVTSVLPIPIQEKYHNLRKELRSLTDEHDLFGATMFPTQTDTVIAQLVVARGLLGQINDDGMARQFYINHDMYPDEQTRLATVVNEAWANFQVWSTETNLVGSLLFLDRSLQVSQS
jgi:hypothetical protein